jgi:hypothetical protein
MARLEWACTALTLRPMPGLDPAALAPEQLEAARFAMHPACCLFEPSGRRRAVAGAPERRRGFPARLAQPCFAVVARPHWKAELVPLGRAAHAALAVLAQGGTFGAALDAAFELDDGFDVAAHLRQWIDLSLLTASRRPVKNGAGAAPSARCDAR